MTWLSDQIAGLSPARKKKFDKIVKKILKKLKDKEAKRIQEKKKEGLYGH